MSPCSTCICLAWAALTCWPSSRSSSRSWRRSCSTPTATSALTGWRGRGHDGAGSSPTKEADMTRALAGTVFALVAVGVAGADNPKDRDEGKAVRPKGLEGTWAYDSCIRFGVWTPLTEL